MVHVQSSVHVISIAAASGAAAVASHAALSSEDLMVRGGGEGTPPLAKQSPLSSGVQNERGGHWQRAIRGQRKGVAVSE